MKKYLANVVTSLRIVGSILMMFAPVFSFWFGILYLFCGVTDMIDGSIARLTHTVSKSGERLDSVADAVFMIIAFIKLLPVIQLPKWLWIWIAIIGIIKIANIITGLVSKEKQIDLHTKWNKLTGLLLFLLPMTLAFIALEYSVIVVCSIATVSAVLEGYVIKTKK
ncbi:MAG: CDP-alcohol phosphatidyltransferase family protein [Lachnospiraceae bacterium]|nr:CDP-alcohol phosphatidyltransferase family protein [Lachnospiraceae bacterium]